MYIYECVLYYIVYSIKIYFARALARFEEETAAPARGVVGASTDCDISVSRENFSFTPRSTSSSHFHPHVTPPPLTTSSTAEYTHHSCLRIIHYCSIGVQKLSTTNDVLIYYSIGRDGNAHYRQSLNTNDYL